MKISSRGLERTSRSFNWHSRSLRLQIVEVSFEFTHEKRSGAYVLVRMRECLLVFNRYMRPFCRGVSILVFMCGSCASFLSVRLPVNPIPIFHSTWELCEFPKCAPARTSDPHSPFHEKSIRRSPPGLVRATLDHLPACRNDYCQQRHITDERELKTEDVPVWGGCPHAEGCPSSSRGSLTPRARRPST